MSHLEELAPRVEQYSIDKSKFRSMDTQAIAFINGR